MRGESLPWLHAVFVDDPQTAKVHMRRVMIPIERERVIGIQPAKVKVAALFRFANRDHIWSRMERRHPACYRSDLLPVIRSRRREQNPYQSLKPGGVLFIESRQRRAVEIQHAHQSPALHQRYHNL